MANPQFLPFPFTGVEAVDLLSAFGLGKFGKLYLWSKSNAKITDTLEKCNEVLVKVDQLQDLSTKVETLEGLVKKVIIQNDSIISGNKGLAKILKQGLNENAGSNLNVQFCKNDTAISVTKVVVVGAIGYGVWKWTGYSVSGIVNGTKRSVAGVLSSMTKNVGKKSAAISEKMRNLSEKLENCGKPDVPKATQNLKKKIPLEGTICKLYRMDEEDIVAEALWATDDPTALVNGCELGRNACKVWVTNAIEPNAKVWRPAFGIQIMEEATKSFIAWPADHIIYDVNYDREAGGSVSEIVA